MKLQIAGNNGPFAEVGGACSSYLLTAGDKNIVFDLGPGSLANLQKFIDIRQIDVIVLSHLHFDHISDIFSLGYALGLLRQREGFDKKIKLFLPDSPGDISVKITEDASFEAEFIKDGKSVFLDGVKMSFCEMTHPVKSFAVKVFAEGKVFAYSGDTTSNGKINGFAEGTDLYLADAGLLSKHAGGPHMTVKEAVLSAKGAKRTLLTHISPLYSKEELFKEKEGNAEFAKLLETYEI